MDSLTPDQNVHENELICERLLDWSPLPLISERGLQQWYTRKSAKPEFTPSFTTWAEAGLILEALQSKLGGNNFNTAAWDQLRKMGHLLSIAKLSPADVRSSALAFIKAWHGE